MIIFANNMQQDFLKSKENKVLIATSIGSGKSYALHLKVLELLEEEDNFVGFCRRTYPQVSSSYYEFKDKFKKYKNLRFSDKSMIVEHKKTKSKVKFVTQESCYGFETVIIDCINHFQSQLLNHEYLTSLKKLYACCNVCDFDYQLYPKLFDKIVTGYGICDELKDSSPNYEKYVNNLAPEDKARLLMKEVSL